MHILASFVVATLSLALACVTGAPRASVDETLALMSSVRGVHPRYPIDHHELSRDKLVERYLANLKQSWEREEGWRYQKALVALGIWPPDQDLLRDFGNGRSSTLGGFYDVESRRLYTTREKKNAAAWALYESILGRDVSHQYLLAHEILHALQHDAHPELFDLKLLAEHEDVAMALSAAKEGDATYFASAVYEGLPVSGPGLLSDERMILVDTMGSAPGVPVWIGYTQLFPYAFGYTLARNEGKRLLDRPPVSTEQVLHPEKRRESFLAMDLGAFESMLPRGCRPIAENTLGELGILILFRELGPVVAPSIWLQVAPDYFQEAERFGLAPRDLADWVPVTIWEGWDGDRYAVAECGTDLEFVWITAWDSDDDARQFQAGYQLIAPELSARSGRSAPPRTRREGRRVVVTTGGLSGVAARLDSQVRETRVPDLDGLRLHRMDRCPGKILGTSGGC